MLTNGEYRWLHRCRYQDFDRQEEWGADLVNSKFTVIPAVTGYSVLSPIPSSIFGKIFKRITPEITASRFEVTASTLKL